MDRPALKRRVSCVGWISAGRRAFDAAFDTQARNEPADQISKEGRPRDHETHRGNTGRWYSALLRHRGPPELRAIAMTTRPADAGGHLILRLVVRRPSGIRGRCRTPSPSKRSGGRKC
jgi:hypothetical protein